MKNLRHISLDKNLKNIHTKSQVKNIYNNWDIYVQKIKGIKMVLNSYFLGNSAHFCIKDMVR